MYRILTRTCPRVKQAVLVRCGATNLLRFEERHDHLVPVLIPVAPGPARLATVPRLRDSLTQSVELRRTRVREAAEESLRARAEAYQQRRHACQIAASRSVDEDCVVDAQ